MTTLPDAKLYIDGKLRDATGGRSYDLISPWTGEPVGKAADATKEDVEEAITAARRAFDETNWSSPENRQTRFELVKKLRELFQENYDRLGDLAVHEAGAARGAVDRAHVAMALDGWDDYLDVFKNVEWEKDYGEKNAFGAMQRIGRHRGEKHADAKCGDPGSVLASAHISIIPIQIALDAIRRTIR